MFCFCCCFFCLASFSVYLIICILRLCGVLVPILVLVYCMSLFIYHIILERWDWGGAGGMKGEEGLRRVCTPARGGGGGGLCCAEKAMK